MPLQCGEFPEPKCSERCKQDEHPIPDGHGVRQAEYLLNAELLGATRRVYNGRARPQGRPRTRPMLVDGVHISVGEGARVFDLKNELHRTLQVSRAGLLSKLEDLSEYDLRRPMTSTGTNLLGLIKHLASVEYEYLGQAFKRPAPEAMSWIEDGSVWEGADMWATPDESSEYLIGLYKRACAHGDQTIGELDLETRGWVAHWSEGKRDTTLGVLLIRMVDETARHAGHADVIRELIDGRAGPDHDAMGDETWWHEYVSGIQAAADSFATRIHTDKPSGWCPTSIPGEPRTDALWSTATTAANTQRPCSR